MSHEYYQNPLIARYASREMSRVWGDDHRFQTWRRLWILLAETERELGLPVAEAQIAELRSAVEDIDFERVKVLEKELRHDVMAHVHAYGERCPGAAGIIHLGATSCYVTDNADLLLIRESLTLLARRLATVIGLLGDFAKRHRDLPCLAYTHLQPAQPTTVGKRATLWAYDLVLDLEEIERRLATLKARSAKGTTGTQASFLELFHGDHAKVRELERRIATKMGFAESYAVTGQTYTRKVDAQIVDSLSGLAQSAHKMATDLRLLSSWRELDEPFEEKQIGSSAMAYKRNPMRSERVCGLARFVISLQSSPANTVATQWMERTLDDSANRRLVLPQAFLAVDAILVLLQNVAAGMTVNPAIVAKRLAEELPFMATENLLMAAVEAGGNRQDLHEVIRQASVRAVGSVKRGEPNDLLDQLRADPSFAKLPLEETLDPRKYVGRAPEQVDEFLAEVVAPIRQRYPDSAGDAQVSV
ncbi:MAG TPA: adenylosuccinate lyase [Pirellulaceae bacterium]|jgi:adenylosuccinate lyase|nr:adenylosuccinate lyase [Pirellulaceae bacterium]